MRSERPVLSNVRSGGGSGEAEAAEAVSTQESELWGPRSSGSCPSLEFLDWELRTLPPGTFTEQPGYFQLCDRSPHAGSLLGKGVGRVLGTCVPLWTWLGETVGVLSAGRNLLQLVGSAGRAARRGGGFVEVAGHGVRLGVQVPRPLLCQLPWDPLPWR